MSVTIYGEFPPYLAIGSDGHAAIVAEHTGFDDEGEKFWVINGAWAGHIKDNVLKVDACEYTGVEEKPFDAEVVWRGYDVSGDYNEAIADIREEIADRISGGNRPSSKE